ncbi:Imm27 family immunity protein [Geobacter sp. DSM 9736]|uniref:Imm27 family immunity protein n=1 Tax=Geobacter sp. DSM 9736 TaxID=1277350 RepID=UPI000B506110|nr:Imm27 family immunity protein [Geobacter sp. DSM 9736]SNB47877.1 Immunity protein 27 [Geobacter sp. DSM 9736]
MEALKPEETCLVGMWLDLGSKVTGDAVSDRIEWLTANRLEHVAAAKSGEELWRDPSDGRLWEQSRAFPGAPPSLRVLTPEEAQEKYGL